MNSNFKKVNTAFKLKNADDIESYDFKGIKIHGTPVISGVPNAETVALGISAGGTGMCCVCIGCEAGKINNGDRNVAIGQAAGKENQEDSCVAIGYTAGFHSQGTAAVAMGFQAGLENQGDGAVAIGANSGLTNQPGNSICLGNNVQAAEPGGFYTTMLQKDHTTLPGAKALYYDPTSKEIFHTV